MSRETRTARILGADQAVTIEQTLKAMTINGAIQYREEHIKGSLEAGKLADMVIFDKNPVKVRRNEVRNLRILQTIKEGTTVFSAR